MTFMDFLNDTLNEGAGNLDFLPGAVVTELTRAYGSTFGENSVVKTFKPEKLDKIATELTKFYKANTDLIAVDDKDVDLSWFSQTLVLLDDKEFVGLFRKMANERKWGYQKEYESYGGQMRLSNAHDTSVSNKELAELAANLEKPVFKLVGVDPVRLAKSRERRQLQNIADKNFSDDHWGGIQAKIRGDKVLKVLAKAMKKKEGAIDAKIDDLMDTMRNYYIDGELIRAKLTAEKLVKAFSDANSKRYNFDVKEDRYYTMREIKRIIDSTK